VLTGGGGKNTYGAAIDTLQQVGKVVQSLYVKVSFFFFFFLYSV
jgi:hypothetical protein